MEIDNAAVVVLHDNKQYLDVCCDLLNDEWPRSTSARLHSLESSCDNFPTSLLLVLYNSNTNEELVIGHSKISPLYKMPDGCFVESVVIAKSFRGKGWGRYIMRETEKYVKSRGKSVIYLSTTDKREFYEKLGYEVCEPVSIYGSRNFEVKNNFFSSFLSSKSFKLSSSSKSNAPAPPPPPKTMLFDDKPKKVYMRKILI